MSAELKADASGGFRAVRAVSRPSGNDALPTTGLAQLDACCTSGRLALQAYAEVAQKVSYYELVLQSESLMALTAIAKDYGLSARKLNRILADQNVQFKQSGTWFLYACYAEQGYTQSRTHRLDNGLTMMHTYWTQKGRLFIYDLLKARLGLLPTIERQAGLRCSSELQSVAG